MIVVSNCGATFSRRHRQECIHASEEAVNSDLVQLKVYGLLIRLALGELAFQTCENALPKLQQYLTYDSYAVDLVFFAAPRFHLSSDSIDIICMLLNCLEYYATYSLVHFFAAQCINRLWLILRGT